MLIMNPTDFLPIASYNMNDSFGSIPEDLRPTPENIRDYYRKAGLSYSNPFLESYAEPTATVETPAKKSDKKNNFFALIEKLRSKKVNETMGQTHWDPKFSTPSTLEDKGKYGIEYFTNKGLSKEQAAGIIGNLHAESALDSTAVGDSGSSYGIAQWRDNRLVNLKKFAIEKGKDVSDFNTQLDFLWRELNTTESPAFNALIKTNTPEDAAKVFGKKFERPKVYNNERHIQARKYYLTN